MWLWNCQCKFKSQSTLRPQEYINHNACSIQHHTSCLKLLTMALWWKPHDARITTPTYISPFQHQHFFFPIDINFSWLHKSVTNSYLHKYWNILLLCCHYHSALIKFPKINLFLSIQLWTFYSQFHRHSYIHQHNCFYLLFLVC